MFNMSSARIQTVSKNEINIFYKRNVVFAHVSTCSFNAYFFKFFKVLFGIFQMCVHGQIKVCACTFLTDIKKTETKDLLWNYN
jgi:hypothetical protein